MKEMRNYVKKFVVLPLLAISASFVSCGEEEIGPDEKKIESPATLNAVDLGLSVLWANVNLGATTPEGHGAYFAWGEIGTKDFYDWSNYTFCNGMDYTQITRYSSADGRKELWDADDAAIYHWQNGWRIPTAGQFEELRTRCTWTWTTINGVEGYQVKGSNGNSIFLPAVPHEFIDTEGNVSTEGCYWSRNLSSSYWDCAQCLVFRESSKGLQNYHRATGCCIRPVKAKP